MFQGPRTEAQVLAGLLELTPKGWALPNDPPSTWASFITPLAAEFSLVETTAAAMVEEVDPRAAAYSLPDYVRVLGPDPYGRDAASLDLTTTELATLTWSRWTDGGNMAPSDYIALAASMGVSITITQFWPTKCGVAQCGQTICADRWVTCGAAACGDLLGRKKIVFTWMVTAPTGAESTPLAAVILGEAPSHTNPVFRYT